MSGLLLSLLVGLGVVALPVRPAAAATTNSVAVFDADEGAAFLTGTRTFSLVVFDGWTTDGSARFSVAENGDVYTVLFAAPVGDTLHTGTYDGAMRAGYREAGRPGLDVYNERRNTYCLAASGSFTVDQIELDGTGAVSHFAARFELRCGQGDPPMHSQVLYRSSTAPIAHALSTDRVTFADTAVGSTSATRTVSLQNTGPTTLHVTSTGITGWRPDDFVLLSNGCASATLLPGGQCSAVVAFRPTGVGEEKRAKLMLFDELAPTTGGGRSVLLTGTAIGPEAPHVSIDLDSEEHEPVGRGQQYHFDTPIAPTAGHRSRGGDDSAGLEDVVDGTHFRLELGAPASEQLHVGTYEFAQSFDNGGSDQPGLEIEIDGRKCTYGITTSRFTVDEIEFGYANEVVRLAARFEQVCDGALFGTITYNTARTYGHRSVEPGEIDFGTRTPGAPPTTRAATFHNDGSLPLHLGTAWVDDYPYHAFAITADACSSRTLAVGATCTVTVSFASDIATMSFNGRLRFRDDVMPDGTRGRSVFLQGATSAAPTSEGEFTPVTPSRLLDTRDGTGRSGLRTPVGPHQTTTVTVAGRGGVPATGVSAVVVNVTATQPTRDSFVTAWSSDASMPFASNLNVAPGVTRPNLVTVAIGPSGAIALYNDEGDVHLLVDVVGFYSTSSGPAGSRFHTTDTPVRVLDTRVGTGAPAASVGEGGSVTIDARQIPGLPTAGTTALVMNVTVTQPTAVSYVTAYPSDVARPLASNLNMVPGETVANLVTVRVPTNGKVRLYNNRGTTDLVADVVGWYDLDRGTPEGRFVPLTPTRFLDTRYFDEPLHADSAAGLPMLAYGGVPAHGVGALVMNLTVTQPTSFGYVLVAPLDIDDLPLASNVNFVAGQTIPNLAISRVSRVPAYGFPAGTVLLYNRNGDVDLVVDVVGYFTDDS